jgi:hypothetical protein
MKTRKGFVSNSSSSSFIIAFPNRIKDVEELKEILFKDQEIYPHPFPYDVASFDIDTVANEIIEKLKETTDKKEMEKTIECGWLDEFDKFFNMKLTIEEERKERKKIAKKMLKEWLKKNKDKAIYIGSFEDKTELGCAIEHGSAFDNVSHIKVSCH